MHRFCQHATGMLDLSGFESTNLPPPAKDPPASLVGFYWWGKIRGFEPTQIQHASGMLAKPVQTLVFSLPLSIGKRAIESTFPVLRHQRSWWVFCWWGKIRGFEPTQIQHAGGMLAKPVQTLVFSLPLSIGKRATESTFPVPFHHLLHKVIPVFCNIVLEFRFRGAFVFGAFSTINW